MSSEFAGIRTLYLESKVAALRTVAMMLVALSLWLGGYAALQEFRVQQMHYDFEHGNNVRCDHGYLAKIVDGTKVTCVMRQVGPGEKTKPIRK